MTTGYGWEQRLLKGIKAHYKGKSKASAKLLNQSLRRAQHKGPREELTVLKPLAFHYYEKKQYERSKKLFDRLFKIIDKQPELASHSELQLCLAVMGLIHKAQNDLDTAQHYFLKALAVAKESNDESKQVEYNIMLGNIALENKNLDEAITYNEHALAIAKKHNYLEHLPLTERVLLIQYGKAGRTPERDKLRNELLDREIIQQRNARRQSTYQVQPVPHDWTNDRIGEFIDLSNKNARSSFVLHTDLYHELTRRDEHFRLVHDATIYYLVNRIRDLYPGVRAKNITLRDEDKLEIYFFLQAHSSFLGGAHLALNGQAPQAQMVLRGCIENALYCFRVHIHPELKSIWLNRNIDAKAVKNNFKIIQIWDDLSQFDKTLYDRIYKLYNRTVDDGAHPNVNAYLQNVSYTNTDGHLMIRLNYLNPPQVSGCVNSVIESVDACLELFDRVFDTNSI